MPIQAHGQFHWTKIQHPTPQKRCEIDFIAHFKQLLGEKTNFSTEIFTQNCKNPKRKRFSSILNKNFLPPASLQKLSPVAKPQKKILPIQKKNFPFLLYFLLPKEKPKKKNHFLSFFRTNKKIFFNEKRGPRISRSHERR